MRYGNVRSELPARSPVSRARPNKNNSSAASASSKAHVDRRRPSLGNKGRAPSSFIRSAINVNNIIPRGAKSPQIGKRLFPSLNLSAVFPSIAPRIFFPLIPKRSYVKQITSVLPDDNTIENMVKELQPVERKCLERIFTGAMSYGSISFEAHTTIAEAVNRMAMAIHGVNIRNIAALSVHAGPKSNSGEGGEVSERDNTIWQSRIRQIASGRFGVNLKYLVNADVLEIKVNQAAKPGRGGQLPKEKITSEIARTRLTQPGVDLISPPPHHDIYSIEDLKQLHHDLRSANPNALISVKLAAGDGIGVIAAGVVKAGADILEIAGLGGGTGATPITAKYEYVHPWETSLAEVHQTLNREGLRNSVDLIVSGGIQTGLDGFKANLLGADIYSLGSATLVSLGCTMAEVCHKGTCPTGIATTNQTLIKAKFRGKPEDVARMMIRIAKGHAQYLRKYGFNDPSQAIGRTDLLEVREHSPLTNLDILLKRVENPFIAFDKIPKVKGSSYQETSLITDIKNNKTEFVVPASNRNLSFGARIGYHSIISPEFAAKLNKGIKIKFTGIAPGQSFGFAAPKGLTLIAPNSNDGSAKSLDGADVFVENITGNQAGYGATRGFFASRFVGDRALVRNSGLKAVVEQMGQMGLNFMTGGEVHILGHARYFEKLSQQAELLPALFREDVVGPNLGAGMTGGKLFLPKKLYDELKRNGYLHKSLADLEPLPLTTSEQAGLKASITKYLTHIESKWVSELNKIEEKDLATQFIKLEPLHKEEKIIPEPIIVGEKEEEHVNNGIKSSIHLKANGITQRGEEIKPPSTMKTTSRVREKDACGTGVLVRRDGKSTRSLVKDCLNLLANLQHRGATGIDPKTGDGCGIAWYGLDEFFQSQFPNLNLKKGEYGVIHVALPRTFEEAEIIKTKLQNILSECGLDIKGFRKTPTNNTFLGHIGQRSEPDLYQFIINKPAQMSLEEYEKLLIKVRLRFEYAAQRENKNGFRPHILSASAYYCVYKALVREEYLGEYFEDFNDPHFVAKAAVPHSRFSTNTLPRFENIQPFSIANNGENNSINLLARELASNPFYKKLINVEEIDLAGLSDSHIMSHYVDMLYLMGFSAEEIAQATIHSAHPSKKYEYARFYNLHSLPFEGPNASIILIGDKIIVVRDKNGFRPQRGIINNDLIYSGSELALPINGSVFDLPPAVPLMIDLVTGECKLFEPVPLRQQFYHQQISSLKRVTSKKTKKPASEIISPKDLAICKLRAGWNVEVHETIMKPLFNGGKGLVQSMGNQGPIEPLVRGAYFYLIRFLFHNFSQVTNPPLAKDQEKSYMSLETFLGNKTELDKLHNSESKGYLLHSPIVNKDQMDQLLSDPLFKYQVIDTNYPVGQYEDGIKNTLQAITEASVSMVRSGINLLILSDLNSNDNRAPIPPVLVASAVDDALLKAGLRRNVNIIMQTAHAYTGIQIAQLIGIGGVEAIYPYPVFVFDPAEGISEEEFNRQRVNYVNAIGDELLGIMSCVGISTVSAYRGCKTYNAIGLNEEITSILGVSCQFGGVGLQEVSRMILTQHRMPLEEGDGKFNWNGQLQRLKIWNSKFTRAMIEMARGVYKEDFAQREKEADTLKRGRPLGWLRLKRSTAWNDENPMPVCILGGGAAGFYLAMALLESKLPLRIIMIEQNEVNKFGLLGDGVAPDHSSTKNQAKIFITVIKDPRVKYYGGIQVGRDVSFEELENNYPCVVDCRGAANDRKLNVPGADIKRVINASVVYSIYNGKFKPFQKANWPFARKSKNPILGVIGSGNVAADLARIFLSDPQKLEKTNINPIFLEYLAQEGPSAIRIFARCHPTDSKIGLKELNELRSLEGVNLCAYFDDSLIDTSALNEQQRKLYAFFSEIKDASYSPKATKYIYFHFQMNIKHFEDKGSEVEATFVKGNGEDEVFRTSNYVVAIGRMPVENVSPSVYTSGWITGEGGSLRQADDSSQKTMECIKQDFYEGKFNNKPVPKSLPWELRSTVGNKEMMSILAWLELGKPIVTIEDLREARHYAIPDGRSDSSRKQEPSVVSSNPASSIPSSQSRIVANCITIVEENSKEERQLSASTNSTKTVLEALKQSGGNFTPPYECDGEQTCGTCVVDVVVPPKKEIIRGKKEKSLLAMNNRDASKSVLACAHKAEDFAESILSFKRSP